jgi:hypothetical protein
MPRTGIPSSVDALQQLVREQQSSLESQQATIDEQAQLITFFREWKRLIDSQRFGSRSEKIPPEQGRLFNEAEIEDTAGAKGDDEIDAIAIPAHTRLKRGRRPLPDFLPVQEILHDLSEDEKFCAHDPDHWPLAESR